MKKWNFHLTTVALVFISLASFNWRYGNETFIFFGFAENKETEIRLEHAVSIHQIYVTPGKRVSKGDVLLEVTRSGFQLEESDLNHDVAKLQSEHQIWESGLRSSVSRLEAQKAAKIGEIQTQIQQLESEMSINKSLIKDLKSISPATDKQGSSPNEIKIQGLKKELDLAVRPLETEIRKLQIELNGADNPMKIQIRKLQSELGFVHEEEDKLIVTAPGDGVVGSVFCKAGEQVPGFTNLLTFYEETPTLVKGYVLESLILQVREGDTLMVNSGVKSGKGCTGKVIGLGSRIVEIPERLRKIPEFKTYGREVLISIPSDNHFLQNERVVLKLMKEDDHSNQLIRAFTPPKMTSEADVTEK